MKPTHKWHFTRLSAIQIKGLCAMAGQAHKIAKQRGHPDAEVDAETWRKNGQDEATAQPGLSLREATQVHYLPIRGYWHVIIGNQQQAFYDFLNSGDQNEATRQVKWRLAGEVSRLADGIKADKLRLPIPVVIDDIQAAKEAWDYTRAVARDKCAGRSIASQTPDELWQLCDTIFNRASAKLKVGKPENRNKSQRAGRKAKKTTPEAPLEPFSRGLETSLPTVQTERHEPTPYLR